MTNTTKTKATNRHNAGARAKALLPFTAGGNAYGKPNFRGGPNEGTTGQLPTEWRERFYTDADEVDYVVYSYATPIAWHTVFGQWVIPPVKYSMSTSHHQSALWPIK